MNTEGKDLDHVSTPNHKNSSWAVRTHLRVLDFCHHDCHLCHRIPCIQRSGNNVLWGCRGLADNEF